MTILGHCDATFRWLSLHAAVYVEFVEHILSLVLLLWHNLIRYHGVFAPDHAWRDFIVPHHVRRRLGLSMDCDMLGKRDDDGSDSPAASGDRSRLQSSSRKQGAYWIPWGELLRRTLAMCPETCSCGAMMVIRDDVTDAEEIAATMTRLGLCSTPPPLGRAAKSSSEVQYVFEDC